MSKKYTATLVVMGKKYTSTGESVVDALANLEVGNVHGRGILTIEGNGQKRERIVPPVQLARLFTPSRLLKEVTLKSFGQLFDF